jgi:predicted O-methyltransferase YrrM
MNSLKTPAIEKALRRLHDEAASDGPRIALGFAKSMGLGLRPHHMKDAYIAVTRGQGQLLYGLARASKAKRLVEFGASFGISAIYLGAAARDNGGRFITTEIEPNKVEVARANLKAAGLDDVAELAQTKARMSDMETLALRQTFQRNLAHHTGMWRAARARMRVRAHGARSRVRACARMPA